MDFMSRADMTSRDLALFACSDRLAWPLLLRAHFCIQSNRFYNDWLAARRLNMYADQETCGAMRVWATWINLTESFRVL